MDTVQPADGSSLNTDGAVPKLAQASELWLGRVPLRKKKHKPLAISSFAGKYHGEATIETSTVHIPSISMYTYMYFKMHERLLTSVRVLEFLENHGA